MKIKNSLDWQEYESKLRQKLVHIKVRERQIEAKKMLNNFSSMITKLSKLELASRTSSSHSLRNVNEQLKYIDDEISKFEQWLTLLILL